MKTKFDILFQVVFEHGYFKDKCLKGLEIRPTEQTLDLLRDYGLLFKRTKTGFVVLYEIDTTSFPEKPLKPIQKELRLSYEIYVKDVCFVNYTQIPLDYRNPDFFYFDNRTQNVVNHDLLLTQQNYVGIYDITELIGEFENIDKPATAVSSLIEVSDLNNKKVLSKKVLKQKDEITGEERFIYQIEFNKIGTGNFAIKIDGNLHKRVYSNKIISRKPVLGIIDIYTTDVVPVAYRFVTSDGTVNKKTYKIRFAPRLTFWKYFIVLKSINTNPGLSIVYRDPATGEEVYPSSVDFKPPNTLSDEDEEFINSQSSGSVLLFQSSKKIPFYEIPKRKISLIKPDETDDDEEEDEDDINDTIIEHLPNATIEAIKPNIDNTETFSEIFIYV